MYQLYYYRLNASMAPHFVLEALNVDFELIEVDRKSNAQKSSEYLALNPAGRIPTLVDGEQVIFESPAICVHLAESHPKANLIPSIKSVDRAKFFQWLMYLTNTVQAELMIYFYPEKHTTDGTATRCIVDMQQQRISQCWALLDSELVGKNALVGDTITVCDYFLFMLAVWSDELERPPLAFPNLSRYLRTLAKDPAIVRACKTENFSLSEYQ